MMLRYNLEREGFAVDEAANGEEALLRIAERRPDAVLLDWMLPHVSGLEVCRQIRRAPATRSLPVIMLTARGEEGDRIRGLDSGADDYVVKPFSPNELIARLRAVIRRTRRSRKTACCVCRSRNEPDRASRLARRQGDPSGADRIPPAAPFHAEPGPRVLARAAARPRLGARCRTRTAHRRCAYPAASPGAQREWRRRSAAHGAIRRLRARQLGDLRRTEIPPRRPGAAGGAGAFEAGISENGATTRDSADRACFLASSASPDRKSGRRRAAFLRSDAADLSAQQLRDVADAAFAIDKR